MTRCPYSLSREHPPLSKKPLSRITTVVCIACFGIIEVLSRIIIRNVVDNSMGGMNKNNGIFTVPANQDGIYQVFSFYDFIVLINDPIIICKLGCVIFYFQAQTL